MISTSPPPFTPPFWLLCFVPIRNILVANKLKAHSVQRKIKEPVWYSSTLFRDSARFLSYLQPTSEYSFFILGRRTWRRDVPWLMCALFSRPCEKLNRSKCSGMYIYTQAMRYLCYEPLGWKKHLFSSFSLNYFPRMKQEQRSHFLRALSPGYFSLLFQARTC